MEQDVEELVMLLAIVGGIALAYGQAFGKYQVRLTDIACAWFGIPSERKGGINLMLGTAMAVLFTVAAAWKTGLWWIVPFSPLAGVIAAVDAATVHDAQKVEVIEKVAEERVQRAYTVGLHRTPTAGNRFLERRVEE